MAVQRKAGGVLPHESDSGWIKLASGVGRLAQVVVFLVLLGVVVALVDQLLR